nr:hypothetical protein [Tanacetum cinerariifolium]
MSRKSAQNMSSNAKATYSKRKVHPSDDGSQPRTICKHGFCHVRCEAKMCTPLQNVMQARISSCPMQRNHTYMIELDGAKSMRKASVKSGGFVRYPFQLISLGSIKLTDNKYLIDKLYLSSDSSTQILDDPQIPALHALLSEDRLLSIPTTLRLRKEHWKTCSFRLGTERTMIAPEEVVDVDSESSNMNTSAEVNITKVKRLATKPAKEREILVSSVFQLELYISDKTASTIVVMFDEPKKELLKCFADSLAAADDGSGFGYADHVGLPLALANIIGTTHTLEMKSHTYYEHGTFASFTCWRIAPEEVVDVDSESSNMNTSAEVNITEVKRLATKPFVITPSKPIEEKVKKELKDSNDEFTGDMDDGRVDGKKSSLTDKRKKKRRADTNLFPVLPRNVFRIDFHMGRVLADVLTYHCT